MKFLSLIWILSEAVPVVQFTEEKVKEELQRKWFSINIDKCANQKINQSKIGYSKSCTQSEI